MIIATQPPLACNLGAIGAPKRTRYNDLVNRLRLAASNPVEVPDGYAFELDTGQITLLEVGEWIGLERLCCPFLTFHLEVAGSGRPKLSLRGP